MNFESEYFYSEDIHYSEFLYVSKLFLDSGIE